MGTAVLTYEERLDQDSRWALAEGSRHFEERSAVFQALRKISQRLDALGVRYAIVGGMALFQHGLRRFTEDVDILVTREDLRTIHARLEGLGYLPAHRHSKHLRDTELGVRIEFLTTDDFPGDGKKKPVAFPDPATVSFESEGVCYVNLSTLVELKLASGMTNPGRLRDLSDVLELIRLLGLPASFADELNPFVRQKYAELWGQGRTRYVTLIHGGHQTTREDAFDALIASLPAEADRLRSMREDGVILEEESGADVRLVTTDPNVAAKYDMVDETELWSDEA